MVELCLASASSLQRRYKCSTVAAVITMRARADAIAILLGRHTDNNEVTAYGHRSTERLRDQKEGESELYHNTGHAL